MKQQQKPLDEQDESNIHIENFAVPFLKILTFYMLWRAQIFLEFYAVFAFIRS